MKIRSYSRKIFAALLMALLLITAVNLVSAAPNQTGKAQAGGTAIVHANMLNVRSGPGVAYPVVAVARWGDAVTLLGRNANSSWAKIRIADGREGWVNASYLSSNTAINSLPDLSETAVPDANARALINEGMLNVRSGPSMAYPVVVAIGNGNYVQVIGRDAGSTWIKVVTHTGHQGWLNSIYTTMTVPLSRIPAVAIPALPSTPIEPSQPVQPVEPSGKTAVVNTGMLNVRSGPGLAYSVVSYLPYGQSVGILGRDANSAWIKVQTPAGPTGWIHSDHTQMNTTLSALPIIESTGVPTAGTAVVISNGLNVRSGSGTNYTVLTGVYYGTTLDVLGRNADGAWLKIQTPSGVVGWVYSAYVSPTVSISQISITN